MNALHKLLLCRWAAERFSKSGCSMLIVSVYVRVCVCCFQNESKIVLYSLCSPKITIETALINMYGNRALLSSLALLFIMLYFFPNAYIRASACCERLYRYVRCTYNVVHIFVVRRICCVLEMHCVSLWD